MKTLCPAQATGRRTPRFITSVKCGWARGPLLLRPARDNIGSPFKWLTSIALGDQRRVCEDIRLKTPDGAGQDASRAAVKISSPEKARDRADPTEWHTCPTRDHEQEKRTWPIGRDEVRSQGHLATRPRAVVVFRPILVAAHRHHRECRYHPHQRRVDALQLESTIPPMADSSHRMRGLVIGRTVYVRAVRQQRRYASTVAQRLPDARFAAAPALSKSLRSSCRVSPWTHVSTRSVKDFALSTR